ncbi:MAG TPA: SpoIIE family protein phosphatase [Clostridia bacterium]
MQQSLKTPRTFELIQKPSASKTKLNIVLKYVIYFFILLVLSRAEIKGLRPFAWGFFAALVFFNQNALVLSFLYIGANIIIDLSINTLISSVCIATVMLFSSLIHSKIKRTISLPLLFVYALVGQAGYLYVCFKVGYNSLNAILNLLFGSVFLYACITVCHCTLIRRLKYRLNKNDLACIAIFFIAFFNGLASFSYFGDAVARACFCLTMLIIVYSLGSAAACGYSVFCGLGIAFATNDITFVASFVTMALTASLFVEISKIMTASSTVLTDIVFGLYFNSYFEYSFISVLVLGLGGLCFVFLPKSALLRIREMFVGASSTLAARHIVNRGKEQLYKRLKELSRIFSDMDRIFRTTVRGCTPLEKTVDLMSDEIPLKLCSSCANYPKCYERKDDILMSFKDILRPAIQKGRATIIDIPTFLTSRCEKINTLINIINEMTNAYKKNNLVMENLDISRVLVAEQFGGISKMMLSIAEETRQGITFDLNNERTITEELTYNDIICQEVILSQERTGGVVAEMVLMNGSYDIENLKNITSKVLKKKMTMVSEEQDKDKEWNIVTLKTVPPYDVIFGSACIPKAGNTISGDRHSFEKINDDKFLMALCDGMGSGESAERLSNTALQLVENFYKAGFDNMTILSSVNKFLAYTGEESFSALDICVINLRECTCDLIKLGAPYGIIKHSTESEIITGGTLPMGILEETKPMVFKKLLHSNDMIILSTDGVTDVFGDEQNYKAFIESVNTSNPQVLADEIMNYCIKADKSAPHDDMSVICARIFPLF